MATHSSSSSSSRSCGDGSNFLTENSVGENEHFLLQKQVATLGFVNTLSNCQLICRQLLTPFFIIFFNDLYFFYFRWGLAPISATRSYTQQTEEGEKKKRLRQTFPKLTPTQQKQKMEIDDNRDTRMVVDDNATVMNTYPSSKRSRNEDSGEENSDGVASSSRAKKKKKKKAPANSTTTANATKAKATAKTKATDDTSVDETKQQNHQPPSTSFVYPLPKKNGSPIIRTDSNHKSSSSSNNGSSSTTTTESNQLMDGGGNSRLRTMEEEGRGLTTTVTATTQQHQQPRQSVRPLPTHNDAAAVAGTTATATATVMTNTTQEVGVIETTTTTPTVGVALLSSQVSSSSSMTFTGNPRVFMWTCVLVCIVLVTTASIMMMPPTFQHIKGTTFAPPLADDAPIMNTNTKTTCHVWELTANEIMPRTMTTTLTASKNTDTPPPSFSFAGLCSSPIRQCCCVCAFLSVVVFLVSEWTHNYSQTDKLYVLQLQL